MIRITKRVVWNILYRVWQIRQMIYFRFAIRNTDELFIFDIDNTLTVNQLGQEVNHVNPSPRIGMVRKVQRLLEDGEAVLFLSARDFRLHSTTKNWLIRQKIWYGSRGLFLVRASGSKLPYLEFAIGKCATVSFFDDMSFNHENGKIRFYDEVIEKFSHLEIRFFGRDFIEKCVQ